MNIQTNNLRKCKVSIFSESYYLVTDESEEQLQKAVFLVDTLMREIYQKTQIADTKKIAVLVALQVASKALASQNNLEKHQEFCSMLVNLISAEEDIINAKTK